MALEASALRLWLKTHTYMKIVLDVGWPIGDASDDIEEFLTDQSVSISFELENVHRVRRERYRTLLENVDETEFLAVQELGARLFFDPAGATNLYGNSLGFHSKRPRTSFSGEAFSENDPAVLVHRLEATYPGSVWLLEQFQALRDQLDSPGFWLPHERFKCIRLLRSEPVRANDDIKIGMVFVATHALRRTGKSVFQDLKSDMTETQLDVYAEQVRARFPELFRSREKSEYKQMLLDLLDENIDRLNTLVQQHDAGAAEHAERTFDRLRVDLTPEGTILRNHLIRCTDRLHRGFETFRKYQAKKRERRRENAEASYEAPERPRIRSRVGAEGLFGMADRHDARFERSAESNVPGDRERQPSWIVDEHEISCRNEISENWTNELGSAAPPCLPTLEEVPIELTANSGAESGLDKPVVSLPPEASHVQAADDDDAAIENSDVPPEVGAPTVGREAEARAADESDRVPCDGGASGTGPPLRRARRQRLQTRRRPVAVRQNSEFQNRESRGEARQGKTWEGPRPFD